MTPPDLDATVAELLPCDCRYPTTKHTMNCAITLRPAVRAELVKTWNEACTASMAIIERRGASRDANCAAMATKMFADVYDLRVPKEKRDD